MIAVWMFKRFGRSDLMQITLQEKEEIGAWTQGEGKTSKARKMRVFSEGNA